MSFELVLSVFIGRNEVKKSGNKTAISTRNQKQIHDCEGRAGTWYDEIFLASWAATNRYNYLNEYRAVDPPPIANEIQCICVGRPARHLDIKSRDLMSLVGAGGVLRK